MARVRGAIRRWGPRLIGVSVTVWVLVGLALLARLDLQDRWRRSSLLERQEEPLPPVLDPARQPIRASEVALPSEQAAPARQQAPGEPTSGIVGSRPTSISQPRAGSELPEGDQRDSGRSSEQPSAPSRNATSPARAPTVNFTDQRVSGLGPTLDEATLHGGWQLTREVFERSAAHPNATVISTASPRLVLIRSFLAPAEVDHLIAQAEGHLERSEVVSDEVSKHEARTSFGAWLNGARRDEAVRAVQHRIHAAVGIPEEFGESIYILRYAAGQQYAAHTDQCRHEGVGVTAGNLTKSCRSFLERAGGPGCGPGAGGVSCGDRIATVILYLRSPTKGGETVFPESRVEAERSTLAPEVPSSPSTQPLTSSGATMNVAARRLREEEVGQGAEEAEQPPSPWYCSEGAGVLKVSPQPGDAVVFWDYVPGEGQGALAVSDRASLHGGCPVLEGEKFIATRWIRAAEFS